ncbi:MAG: hypothetical protein R3199_08635 [Gemmatimonadota bacterium]|nr:hypothetical protein [Gemmatimonadota bacterium]
MSLPIALAIAAVVALLVDFALRKRGPDVEVATTEPQRPMWIRAIVSIAFAVIAFYIILSPEFGEAEKKWAFGAAGTVLGYWLG